MRVAVPTLEHTCVPTLPVPAYIVIVLPISVHTTSKLGVLSVVIASVSLTHVSLHACKSAPAVGDAGVV